MNYFNRLFFISEIMLFIIYQIYEPKSIATQNNSLLFTINVIQFIHLLINAKSKEKREKELLIMAILNFYVMNIQHFLHKDIKDRKCDITYYLINGIIVHCKLWIFGYLFAKQNAWRTRDVQDLTRLYFGIPYLCILLILFISSLEYSLPNLVLLIILFLSCIDFLIFEYQCFLKTILLELIFLVSTIWGQIHFYKKQHNFYRSNTHHSMYGFGDDSPGIGLFSFVYIYGFFGFIFIQIIYQNSINNNIESIEDIQEMKQSLEELFEQIVYKQSVQNHKIINIIVHTLNKKCGKLQEQTKLQVIGDQYGAIQMKLQIVIERSSNQKILIALKQKQEIFRQTLQLQAYKQFVQKYLNQQNEISDWDLFID